jgi:hypothetical protein
MAFQLIGRETHLASWNLATLPVILASRFFSIRFKCPLLYKISPQDRHGPANFGGCRGTRDIVADAQQPSISSEAIDPVVLFYLQMSSSPQA